MAKRTNRICHTCGTAYAYCRSCAELRSEPSWKILFHEKNCRDIFRIASEYDQEQISGEEAYELLTKCDLKNKDNFKEDNGVKGAVEAILAIKKENTKSKKESVETEKA